jgi:Reverse transcriptase (RNA-dependent DNA polymerase)
VHSNSDQDIKWLESYLTGRTSYVSIGNRRFPTLHCKTGVPQGSVDEPLLFSIFTSSVSRLINEFNVSCYQYADDTHFYTSIDLLCADDINNLSSCANAVTRLHLENSLQLNPTKTEAIVTGTLKQVSRFNNASNTH